MKRYTFRKDEREGEEGEGKGTAEKLKHGARLEFYQS